MWPKSRPPTASYQPILDTEQQQASTNQSVTSPWPKAPIPRDQLLGGNATLKREQLLGGDNRINQDLLLGGNKPLAEHLLLQPRPASAGDGVKQDASDDEDDDFEHLDYLEPRDDMPLTSRRGLRRQLPRISVRSAVITATVLVVILCLVTVVFAVGGQQHTLGPGDYRRS